MTLKRRKTVLALLILVLGLAVYLNLRFAPQAEDYVQPRAEQTGRVLGQAQQVSLDTDIEVGEQEHSGVIETMSPGGDYFVQARLTRQKTRDEARELLKSMLESDSAGDDAKLKAQEDMLAMAAATEAEGNIENLITAKGFEDAIAFINGDVIDVVVKSPALDSAQVARIKDIILSQSDIQADSIRISNVD